MDNVMLYLHLLGAAGLGFYLVLPLLVGRASKLAGTGQEGLADGLAAGNRFAQYFLILQLLTGGYLISQNNYSVAWMIIIIVLFLAIAAISGVVGKPLRMIISSIQDGKSATNHIQRARMLSVLILILYLVVLYLMKFPMYK